MLFFFLSDEEIVSEHVDQASPLFFHHEVTLQWPCAGPRKFSLNYIIPLNEKSAGLRMLSPSPYLAPF